MTATKEISSLYFSFFRFAFGIMMVPQVLNLVPYIHDLSNSTYVFHYPYLSFIDAYSHTLIDVLAWAGVAGAILLALGIVPRVAAAVFMVSFGYLFLIDVSFYNNHYYLWCLLAFLFAVCETDKSVSVVDVFKKRFDKKMDISNYFIFGSMVSIVYFYGGTAKLNADWLQGYPMRMVAATRGYPDPDFWGYFISYAGIAFDLLVGIVLWYRPKAWYVAVPYFVFHLCNYFLFNIGEFPLVMMCAWVLYLPLSKFSFRDLCITLWARVKRKPRYMLLAVFFAFQLLFPIRSWFAPGPVGWTRQGDHFSWRMMLNNHEVKYFQFMVKMPDLNDGYQVDFKKLLTYRQFYHAYSNPRMIWLLAQKLKADAQKKYNTRRVHVYCRSVVTLNQHPPKPLINDTVDLGAADYRLYSTNAFINPF